MKNDHEVFILDSYEDAKTGKSYALNITVNVEKLTDKSMLYESAQTTSWSAVKERVNNDRWYKSEHSPIRTQMFYIRLRNIPQFVHTHYVRHTVWNQPYVRTGREDRGKEGEQTRWSPNDMDMLVNAQTLINMARKRLCNQAHDVTVMVMDAIKDCVFNLDEDLANNMVRECIYRCGYCPQHRPCGFLNTGEAIKELRAWLGSEKSANKRTLLPLSMLYGVKPEQIKGGNLGQ